MRQLRTSFSATTPLKSFSCSFFWSILCRMADIVVNKFAQFGQNAPCVHRIHKNITKITHLHVSTQFTFFACSSISFETSRRGPCTHRQWSLLAEFRTFSCRLQPYYPFWEGHVFGFEIIKIFRHATTFFFRISWAWEQFMSCSNTCLLT